MSRYIDAELLEPDTEWDFYEECYVSYSQLNIDTAETADVRENVKGRWIENDLNATCGFHIPSVKCSICGEIAPCVYGYNFCPNCGAQMMRGEA